MQLTNLSLIYTCTNCQLLSTKRARKYESITPDQLSISTVHIMKSNPIFIISHLLQPRRQPGEVNSLFEMEKIMENIIDFTLQMAIQMVSVSFFMIKSKIEPSRKVQSRLLCLNDMQLSFFIINKYLFSNFLYSFLAKTLQIESSFIVASQTCLMFIIFIQLICLKKNKAIGMVYQQMSTTSLDYAFSFFHFNK